MSKLSFNTDWGIVIDNTNKLYNIKCFGKLNNEDFFIMIKMEDAELSEVELFYEDYYDIRYRWERLNSQKLNQDDNVQFICKWSVNCLDYLADIEYFQLNIFHKYCYTILGKYIENLKEIN